MAGLKSIIPSLCFGAKNSIHLNTLATIDILVLDVATDVMDIQSTLIGHEWDKLIAGLKMALLEILNTCV